MQRHTETPSHAGLVLKNGVRFDLKMFLRPKRVPEAVINLTWTPTAHIFDSLAGTSALDFHASRGRAPIRLYVLDFCRMHVPARIRCALLTAGRVRAVWVGWSIVKAYLDCSVDRE